MECKPNFELSYLPFAISVPVYDDTGKFQHSCKETKMPTPPPAVILSVALVTSGREYVGDSRERAVAWWPLYL